MKNSCRRCKKQSSSRSYVPLNDRRLASIMIDCLHLNEDLGNIRGLTMSAESTWEEPQYTYTLNLKASRLRSHDSAPQAVALINV